MVANPDDKKISQLNENAAVKDADEFSTITPRTDGTVGYENVKTKATTLKGYVNTDPAVKGQATFEDGTQALPSIAHVADTDTGIRFPAQDTLALVTAGVDTVTLDPNNNTIIGPPEVIKTTDRDGFLYLPTMDGTPAVLPRIVADKSPIVVDTVNNVAWIYINGVWMPLLTGNSASVLPVVPPPITRLDGLSDVAATGANLPQNGNTLIYNNTLAVWQPGSMPPAVTVRVDTTVAYPNPVNLPVGQLIVTEENAKKEIAVVDASHNIVVLYSDVELAAKLANASLFQGVKVDVAGLGTLPAPAPTNKGFYWIWSGTAGQVIATTDFTNGGGVAATLQVGDWLISDGTNFQVIGADLMSKQRWVAVGSFQTWIDKAYEIDTLISYNGRLYRASAAIPAGTGAPGVAGSWVDITPHNNLAELIDTDMTTVAPAAGDTIKWDATTSKWRPGKYKIEELSDVIDNVSASTLACILVWDPTAKQWTNSRTINIDSIEFAASGAGTLMSGIAPNTFADAPVAQQGVYVPSITAVTAYVTATLAALRLTNLADVTATMAPTDKQILSYDLATTRWLARDEANAISKLTDVDLVTNPQANNQYLGWSSTSSRWVPITLPATKVVATAAALPDPATATPALADGQLAIVQLDAVAGRTIDRPFFFDATANKWVPLLQGQMGKALRTDTDHIASNSEDLQVTYETDHQEIKSWDGTAWQTIYSLDYIKQLINQSSSFEGTADAVGGTVAGAIKLNALPDLTALTTAKDFSKLGHYWIWQGPANYAVSGTTPIIGTDLNGAKLNVGDWLSVSNTGTVAAPSFKWNVVTGDALTKARGEALFGLSTWAAGTYESGTTVVYNGSIYRATTAVVPTDAAPGTVGAPWTKIVLATGGITTVAGDVNLPAAGTAAGDVVLIQSSAANGNFPAFMMWNGTAWVNTAGDALTKTRWDTIGTLQTWTNKQYELNSLVSYNGRYYRASGIVAVGTPAPGVSPLWTDITPAGLSGVPTWDAVTAYAAYVLVQRSGSIYYSTSANTNIDPLLSGTTTKTVTPTLIAEMDCVDGVTNMPADAKLESFDFSTSGVTPGEYYFVQMDDNQAAGPPLGIFPYTITAGQFKGKQLTTEETYVVYTGNKLNGIYGWVLVPGGQLGSAVPATFTYADSNGNPWTQVTNLKIGDMLDVSKSIPAQSGDVLVYNAVAGEWIPAERYPKIAAMDTIDLVNSGAAWTGISNTWKNATTLSFPIDTYIPVGNLFRVELNYSAVFVNPTVKASSCLVIGTVKVRGAGSPGWRDATLGTGVTKVIAGERYLIGTVSSGMTIGVAIDLLSSATTDCSNTVKGNVVFYDLGPASEILKI